MNKMIITVLLAIGVSAHAETKEIFSGSDTLAGAITDAIIQSGMDQVLGYAGGGSGVGETNLIAGDQGIAPMSRPLKPEAIAAMASKGNSAVAHVIGLDGVSVYVNNANKSLQLDVLTVTKLYTCELTRWEQISNSGLKGDIHVFRRNDSSGTTDAFKSFTGIKTFGACAVVVEETADISEKTSRDPLAVGYAGLSGKVEDNYALALSPKVGVAAIAPTTATIRNGTYPFTRKLFIFELTGKSPANSVEQEFLSNVTDRSFMDPIMQAHEFVTID